jgi:hypothetical protein
VTISRVIGDLLVDLIQHKEAEKPDRLGHGYLISDYPVRGLVEIYSDKGRRFNEEEVALARGLAGEVSDLLRRLERPEQPG